MEVKTCIKCGFKGPALEFRKEQNVCKKCFSAYMREYREKNSDKLKAWSKEYYEINKDKMYDARKKEYLKTYSEKNKDKVLAWKNAYCKKNREKELARHKIYRENNRDKERLYKKEYREKNQEKINARQKSYYTNMCNSYIVSLIKRRSKINNNDILQHPELIEFKRTQIQLHRLLKEKKAN